MNSAEIIKEIEVLKECQDKIYSKERTYELRIFLKQHLTDCEDELNFVRNINEHYLMNGELLTIILLRITYLKSEIKQAKEFK